MIKKGRGKTESDLGIKKSGATDAPLKFSFSLFDTTDEDVCPKKFPDGYTRTLMERLKALSTWTVKQFTTTSNKSVRNHSITWAETARPDGFKHLNEQFRSYTGWQFSLTANEHGRVHGIIIDDTFYVIWLDCGHRLYP